MSEFKVNTVDLKGQNLVEASAGTGKTYSIAIMVLRLLLEKKISIDKILMVTFTNAAVAELESRIRKFVRLGLRYVKGEDIEDENIKNIVGETTGEKLELLTNAVLMLDSLSVMTIHSFCQQSIAEFTFETHQSFDYEILTDDMPLIQTVVDKYIREKLNTIDYEVFKNYIDDIKISIFKELIRKKIESKIFYDSNLTGNETYEALLEKLSVARNDFENFLTKKFQWITDSNLEQSDLTISAAENNFKKFQKVFLHQANLIRPARYFADYASMVDKFLSLNQKLECAEKQMLMYLTDDLLNFAATEVEKIKKQKGLISYNDQIKTINIALNNSVFVEKMAEKFDAVFIDEFQDTDTQQFQIFSGIFGQNKTMFFIGDPKQSIYAWRGADLDTYIAVLQDDQVTNYTMNKNFRSTPALIKALNHLFYPKMFEDTDIQYQHVEAAKGNDIQITENGETVKAITIWDFDQSNKNNNPKAVAKEIYHLLTTDKILLQNRRIKPNDIAVLVRGNKEGLIIKKALSRLNIPSVIRDDTKVFQTNEADMIKYLIEAAIYPERKRIIKALYSVFYGFEFDDIVNIDDTQHLDIFLKLKYVLQIEGIYNMVDEFLDIYNVRNICVQNVLGQRVLSNLIQITEILHQTEKKYRYSPDELLVWMKRSEEDSDENYQQRVESDENAVQISTIHKAKGLEYNIVFAPYLNIEKNDYFLKKNKVNDFKKEGNYYFTRNYKEMAEADKNLFDLQKEQENRRLIYVALTRPVYKCYISNVQTEEKNSLAVILSHFQDNCDQIEKINYNDFVPETGKYQGVDNPDFVPRKKPEIEIKNTFGIHSFSGLSKVHFSAEFEEKELDDAYDQFIFQSMGRGANIGTALHSIFERLQFDGDSESWNQTLDDASKYYPNLLKQENRGLLMQLVEHTMNVNVGTENDSFALKEVGDDHKLPELEFYFPINRINKTVLNKILGDDANLNGEVDLEGLMTGFIDLFFEHKGKYYILDWKSNHLGNDISKYDTEGMEAAMQGNNYHLQYHIYTLAATRYLKTKIPDFDYETQFGGIIYLFLRGLRKGESTGIYINKPDAEKLLLFDQAL